MATVKHAATDEAGKTAMDGDLNSWWIVLSALMVVLALPNGDRHASRRPRRSERLS